MKTGRIILLLTAALVALGHRSDGQQARPIAEQLRLAGSAPRGALLYLQARDLSALMRTWVASPVRDEFYKSRSFSAFSNSRVFLKLQQRREDFEKAVGFGLGEERLAELAGGASALAIYDIGALEMIFVTEAPRERAIATVMFKQAPQFQERSADGVAYYVRDVTSDFGRLKQQFCFAYSGGKLIVTTTEGLMVRALRNEKGGGADSLLPSVLATAERARGFAAHEVTMWLDQGKLNANRYFNNYWLHQNVRESKGDDSTLAGIESGLVDLQLTRGSMVEQRWFVLRAEGRQPRPAPVSAEQAGAFARFAPADAHLIEVRAGDPGGRLGETIFSSLFGRLPDETRLSSQVPDRTRSSDDDSRGSARAERYSRLDARFDNDVDDDMSLSPARASDAKAQPNNPAPPPSQTSGLTGRLEGVMAAASPAGYCEIVRSRMDRDRPFARFERAIVVEMKGAASLDRAALEKIVADEMRARFVVSGVDPQLAWQAESSVRYLAQSLLEQGAAYSVSDRYLVLASSREFARDILQAAATQSAPQSIDGDVEFYAVVKIADAKPVFDKLMSKLDGKTEADGQDEGEGGEVKFFSENISSLIGASKIREARLRRVTDGAVVSERVIYSW
ncbi:MAG TPA: hypothetical protein VE262_08380 [Blastocatellia bacterium]|nr:hypothetical protein [Blastocatellia bacterium]